MFDVDLLSSVPTKSKYKGCSYQLRAGGGVIVCRTQNVSRLRMPAHRGKSFYFIFNHYKV